VAGDVADTGRRLGNVSHVSGPGARLPARSRASQHVRAIEFPRLALDLPGPSATTPRRTERPRCRHRQKQRRRRPSKVAGCQAGFMAACCVSIFSSRLAHIVIQVDTSPQRPADRDHHEHDREHSVQRFHLLRTSGHVQEVQRMFPRSARPQRQEHGGSDVKSTEGFCP